MNSKFYITFAVLWTITEAALNLLGLRELLGVKEWSIWLLRSIFALILIISLIIQAKHYFGKKKKYYKGSKLVNKVKSAISTGLSYLESTNVNKYGQRLRLTPSIMESSTVVGAIYLASNILTKNPKIAPETINWLFAGLKKQFQENAIVKHFDCSRCDNGNICNAAYFDYLSHFYYTKNTELYRRFCEEFKFMAEVLKSRLIEIDGMVGWPLFSGEIIDPLPTATNLILHSLFPCLTPAQEKAVINTLLKLQVKNGPKIGSWQRTIKDKKWCTGELPIITVHRVVEALTLFRQKYSEMDTMICDSVNLAAQYLKSSPGAEAPVNYEYRMGIDDEEILRGVGHMIQALVKAKVIDEFVERQVNYLINLQHDNGSFIGRSEAFSEDRELTNRTDLTAFITRTLCIFYASRSIHLLKA